MALVDGERKPFLKFDGTVTAGNLLTAVGMFIPVFWWGTTVETRLAEKEATINAMQRQIDRDSAAHQRSFQEIKDGIYRIEDKLDKKVDK